MALHPDKATGGEAEAEEARRRFELVSRAHAILSDKFKRWQLDAGADSAQLAKQEQVAAEMAYYAQATPNGFTRDQKTMNTRTGGRTYNPMAKPSNPFECDPCRHDALHSQPSLAASQPIRLKQGGAQLLR